MFFWMALHISIAYGRRGWRKGASALRWRIRTWISARSSSNVASRSLDSDILLDTHWLIDRQEDRCLVKALLCVVSLFLAFSLGCHWFELVGTEFELTPSQLWCSNTSIFTWVCLNDPIQPRWLKFASLCLGSDSNLFEPAFRRQAWKFSASANLKWCSGQFQDNFETMLKSNSRLFQAQNYSLGRLKALTISKRCTRQIRGIDKLEMTFQTNLGLGSVEATGWWASCAQTWNWRKLDWSRSLYFSAFLYMEFFSILNKNVFLILESNSSESIGRGSINSLTLISPFL